MNWNRAIPNNPNWTWTFPRPLLPDLSFKTEWWWWGSHVNAGDERFSVHAVLFRFGQENDSGLASSSWVAQWAITRHSDESYYTGETVLPAPSFPADGNIGLCFGGAEHGVRLSVDYSTPVLTNGTGITQKGPSEGDASYHFSCPSSKCRGGLRVGGKDYAVRGLCWFDREMGSDMFGGAAGEWLWASAMFSDGTHLSKYNFNGAPPGIADSPEVSIGFGDVSAVFTPIHHERFNSKLTQSYHELPCKVRASDGREGYGWLERASGVRI